MKTLVTAKPEEKQVPEREINRRTFISFTTFIALGTAMVGGLKWLYTSEVETAGITAGVKKPFRRALNKTELFFRRTFSNNHLAQTYPKSSAAKKVRVNSLIGLEDQGFKPETWQLSILKSPGDVLQVSLDDLKRLPKTEIIFDFKCVEGWSQIQHWAGVRFTDFISAYKLDNQAKKKYVGMETPDGEYYVGLDTESVMHPQTILAYEMNDAPLQPEHGAPLRLIIPVKYGIKNLKRIASINFSNQRPRDYWAERGYDYYSGL